MPSRLPAVLTVFAVLALVAGAEPPKPEYRAAPTPALDTETQIACAVRVLTVREDLFERAGIDARQAALSDAQLRALLDTVQGDRLSNVMQCPKVTLFDGQEATVRATQTEFFVTTLEATRVKGNVVLVPKQTTVETGTTLTLCAKASADRKTASVRVHYTDTRVEGTELIPVTTQITPVSESGSRGKPVPLTQYLQVPKIETVSIEKKDLTIPSGGHMLLPGPTRVQETRQEFGPPPVLARIPYVNRMYKTVGVGRTTVRTYLIVSPVVLDVPPEPAPGR